MQRAAMSAEPTAPSSRRPVVAVRDVWTLQVAAADPAELADGALDARSAVLRPAATLDSAVVAGQTGRRPRSASAWPSVEVTAESINSAQMVVTLGSGGECPVIPGRRYEDWDVDDPAGEQPDGVRAVRDDIKHRVQQLMFELQPALHPDAQ